MGSRLQVGHFCVVGCACAVVFGAASAVPGRYATGAVEHGSMARPSGHEWPLAPIVHPRVSAELSLLWLAPAGEEGGAGRTALARLTSGIELYQSGKYLDALPAMAAVRSLDKPMTDYAAYYAALAQLKAGRVDLARRQFAALTAGRPVGHLSEAAALGEAEAAEAAADYTGARRVYERLLARSPMAPDYVWFRLGKASLGAGSRAQAIAAFRHLYVEFPLSQHALDAASALAGLGALEPMAPGNARYRVELTRADLLFQAKRYDEARSAFERLLPHATGDERDRLVVRRAACDYFTRRYAAARGALRSSRDRGAHQAEARFFDLMAARARKEDAAFERLARELLDRFGSTVWAEEALNTLATHYLQRNQDDEADGVFRRILAKFPTGRFAERASWKVAWRAYRFGSAAEAAQVFERAASAFPRSDYRPAYLYWAARARESIGEQELAALRYALVRTDYLHSYYGRLADAALEQRDAALRVAFDKNVASANLEPDSTSAALPPTAKTIRLLLAAGLYDEALNEVRYAQHRWGDSAALQATLGWLHHQKGDLLAGAHAVKRAYPHYIGTAGETLPSELLAVVFPMGYWSLIRQRAARHGLDPFLLAALTAQESGFVPDIRSPAGATGLMQLMPATAQRYARKLAISYSPTLLTRPETNIRLGTAYFADLLREFGHVHLALASYNAGENRVRRWVAERPAGLSPDEFIDDIPFPETQNYVKKILGAAGNYRRVYGADTGTPSDPNRAIPSLASRRSSSVQRPK